MDIGELCSREVYLTRGSEPLADAARLMRKHHIGALVVVESRGKSVVPVGIVTDRDIVCGQLTRKADLFCLSVEDVMSRDLLCLGETCDLSEAIRHLHARGVRRAPVINQSGELVGIVSLDDIVPAIAAELGGLAHLMQAQPKREPPR